MSATARTSLLRTALVLFALVDLLALVSFVFNQWFAVPVGYAVGFAGLLALPATMLVLPMVDTVLDGIRTEADIPFAGDKIPGAGQ